VDEPREPSGAAGWHPDPTGKYEFRWFNGTRWTADVSVDGQRYVDHSPMHVATPTSAAPSRSRAVVAFVFGLVGLALAWVPFLVAVGVPLAIAGGILGISAARRAARGQASGRKLATAGIVTGVAAICLCPLGIVLTKVVYDEVRDYIEPGPNDAQITSCARDAGTVDVTGTIENQDDREHDYIIRVDVGDSEHRREHEDVHVDGVGPGERRDWHLTVIDGGTGEPRCEIGEVWGPYPFGIRPAGSGQMVDVDATQAAYIRA
jgi:hypothetical protein